MNYTPEQLQNAIEAGLPPASRELSALVRLSRRLFSLRPEPPSAAASDRMAARFESVLSRRHRPWFAALVPARGTLDQRPGLIQRLAASALVLSAAGGATSAATGVTPAEAGRAVVQLAGDLVANLSPHGVFQGLEPVVPPPAQADSGEPGAGDGNATAEPPAKDPEAVPATGPDARLPAPPADAPAPPAATPTPALSPTPATPPPTPTSTPAPPSPAPGANPSPAAPGTEPGPPAPSPAPPTAQPPVSPPAATPTPTPTVAPPPAPGATDDGAAEGDDWGEEDDEEDEPEEAHKPEGEEEEEPEDEEPTP